MIITLAPQKGKEAEIFTSPATSKKELKKLRDRKLITTATYRKLYKNAKGGMFNSVAQMNRHIKEKDLIKRGRS